MPILGTVASGYFELPAGRALFAGGSTITSAHNTVDYVTITTAGNATDFGDLSSNSIGTTGFSSSTRGVFAIGATNPSGSWVNTLDYFTISTTGNATDFGDTTLARSIGAGISSSTRGCFLGGYDGVSPFTAIIDYITIATTGNAINFGNSTISGGPAGNAGLSSPTRGVSGGGSINGGNNYTNIIEYITIATTGNATYFGDLVVTRSSNGGASSSTRGIFAAGIQPNGTRLTTSDYITIATTGNGTTFGNLTVGRFNLAGTSNSITAIYAGGSGEEPTTATQQNVIDTFTIATTGNGTDFGDLTLARNALGACSNAHGGL